MLCLKVLDKEGNVLASEQGEQEVNLVLKQAYGEGDRICLETSGTPLYVWLSVDDALGKSLVYLTGNTEYVIPFGEKRINLSPKAFWGERHLISVRIAREFEQKVYRNLTLNVNDQHGIENCYPHATANVETRGESVFAAQNAIDGVTATASHGKWPYESWGINRDPEAAMMVDFGRMVETDRIILYLRADFPHDNWWKEITVSFSDGTSLVLNLVKTGEGQEFTFERKQISWLKISELIPSEEESPFPALTQIEVYGTDAE